MGYAVRVATLYDFPVTAAVVIVNKLILKRMLVVNNKWIMDQ
jgi:hypothetical protein